jgi:two-component system, sensor histidine kinase ChiS
MEQTHAATPSLNPPPQDAEQSTRGDELARLTARLAAVERERDHLAAIVDILQEVSSSLHFVDVLQTIARKLGETFGLDRCAIFLSGDKDEVRLVASYEDPSIRNLVVDLNRYPELKRAFESGETVFIPDAANDPSLASIKATLDLRNVRSIVVVPIRWEGSVIGAIFLRTERDADPFS